MNPDIVEMLRSALAAASRCCVLTNAMRPDARFEDRLYALRAEFGTRLTIRAA